jgi:cyclophilin family peptidyl-prolyl cis-trans isomerase
MKKLLQFCVAGLAVFILAATSTAHAQDKPRVEMKTSQGTMVIELDPAAAPKTVANFLDYVKSGQYDGLIFHRVIKGFMIQGGGHAADLSEKATKGPIQNEAEMAFKAGLKNDRGTIAMARKGEPHSATAQFFINHGNNDMLNFPSRDGWGYVAFGRVVSGLDVLDKIAELPTTPKGMHQNVPQTTVTIEKVTLVTRK